MKTFFVLKIVYGSQGFTAVDRTNLPHRLKREPCKLR